jgi:hypothetical protein
MPDRLTRNFIRVLVGSALERTVEAHDENLTRVHREIMQMKQMNEGDSTQAGVDSKQ